MKIVKITTIVFALIMLATPLIGAATIINPISSPYNYCKGMAFGEIEDYKLSLIAHLIYVLKEEPSSLLITRATIVIRQNHDRISLELIDPIKHYCMAYYGNITINFFASIATLHLDAIENCNCTHIICRGIFGHIYVERN